MKPPRWLLPIAALLFSVAASAQAPGEPPREQAPAVEAPTVETPAVETVDRWGDLVTVFSGDVLVPAGTRQRGTVVCIGGQARIEGTVMGDVVVIMGSLDNLGSVEGAVTGVLSDQRHSGARIRGELVNVLGSLDLRDTRVSRELYNILGGFRRDAASSTPSVNVGFGSWFPDLHWLLVWLRLARLFAIFVVLLLLVALVPERIGVIAGEAPLRYASAFFVGLLGFLGLLVALALLSVTVIGMPLALVLWLVFKWMGAAGIFLAVGRRLGRVFGRELSTLGAVMLVFGLYALITVVPTPLGIFGLLLSGLFSAMFFVVVEVPAVGLMLLTFAGGRPGRGALASSAPAAPPP